MRVLFFVLVAASLVACTNSTVPADIIPPGKMETIIWQLMQSDEYANIRVAKDSSKKVSTEKTKIYQEVFDLNGTSLGEFKKSYGYYMAHPDMTRVIFDSIAAKAGRQRADLYKAKPDTIKPKPVPVNLPADTLKLKKPAVLRVRPDSLKPGPAAARFKPPRIKTLPHRKAVKKP